MLSTLHSWQEKAKAFTKFLQSRGRSSIFRVSDAVERGAKRVLSRWAVDNEQKKCMSIIIGNSRSKMCGMQSAVQACIALYIV